MGYTISNKKRCITKDLPLDEALKHVKEELESLQEDEEIDLHFWKEEK